MIQLRRHITGPAVALALAASLAGVASAGVPTSAAPTEAVDDSFPATEDQVLIVSAPGLLENDNPGPDTCVVGVDYPELQGTVVFHTDGSFEYTPTANFNGVTSFAYGMRIAGDDQCTGPADSQGTVTITVAPVNDPPTATADSFIALKDRTLVVGAPGVLINDSDIDGNPLTAVKVTDPAHGLLVLASNGSFSYTPSAGYTGPDAFSYRASDGLLSSPTRVVTLTVTAIPPVPTPTPAPTPTPEPTVTPEPTIEEASPTPEASPSLEPSASVAASDAASPSPEATPEPSADPSPTGDGSGVSLPVLLVLVLLVLLIGFGAAIYVPKWLATQRGEPFDEGGLE